MMPGLDSFRRSMPSTSVNPKGLTLHSDHRPRAMLPSNPAQAGFTLIELLVAIVVVAILAAIALPSYTSYINKSRARGAGADLAALALNMENRYQLQLSYPVYSANTAATNAVFSAWSPTQASNFSYSMVSTATSYTLTATGKGGNAGCTLTLNNLNTRTATAACGFTTW